MKSILITGGTGFIGSNLCNYLYQRGYKIFAFDNNLRGKRSRLNKNIKFIHGDIRFIKNLNKCKKFKIDAVVHLAYINGTKFFYSKPELVLDVAVKGLINIFDFCIKNKIKNLFLASSSEVYQTPLKIPTTEKEPIKIPDIENPRYSYSGGKILTELYGKNFGKKYFKKLIIFRPHNVYGPDMGNEHVIPELLKKIKNLKNNKEIVIEGSGQETRSFIYIDEFCRALEILIKKGKHLEIYNIGTEEEVKIINLVKIISNIININLKIIKKKLKKGGAKRRCPNISKIRKIGFKNKIKLSDGLRLIIKDYNKIYSFTKKI
jgi:nucleoside-diphosphate-sugar epimerase